MLPSLSELSIDTAVKRSSENDGLTEKRQRPEESGSDQTETPPEDENVQKITSDDAKWDAPRITKYVSTYGDLTEVPVQGELMINLLDERLAQVRFQGEAQPSLEEYDTYKLDNKLTWEDYPGELALAVIELAKNANELDVETLDERWVFAMDDETDEMREYVVLGCDGRARGNARLEKEIELVVQILAHIRTRDTPFELDARMFSTCVTWVQQKYESESRLLKELAISASREAELIERDRLLDDGSETEVDDS